MLAWLPYIVQTYWPYLAGFAAVCAVAAYFSRKFRVNLKRVLVVLVLLFCLAAAYELVTGRSVFRLPGDVDRELSKDPSNPESGHRYYKSYEERYGKDAPEADKLQPAGKPD